MRLSMRLAFMTSYEAATCSKVVARWLATILPSSMLLVLRLTNVSLRYEDSEPEAAGSGMDDEDDEDQDDEEDDEAEEEAEKDTKSTSPKMLLPLRSPQ